ncbi:hypothetical protein L798_07630 [Zootermopsis nevadensis]|uniref:Uncharacterized protein n=1 Tax=Zootermopsis nevadensis TaxID=136037 RepID=A0A067RMH9_ZOONE|nr:hypothetical protein L798_07630 [Zootermopsis nevadensis]
MLPIQSITHSTRDVHTRFCVETSDKRGGEYDVELARTLFVLLMQYANCTVKGARFTRKSSVTRGKAKTGGMGTRGTGPKCSELEDANTPFYAVMKIHVGR